MSGVRAIRYLLANNAALTSVVPAANIKAVLPQGVTRPAIEVKHISTTYRHMIASSEDCRSRVQVTVHATSYPSQHSILSLVREALPRTHGTVDGVEVKSLIKDVVGPDMRNDDIQSFIGSQDFIIEYKE